jgi:hypothetical protein
MNTCLTPVWMSGVALKNARRDPKMCIYSRKKKQTKSNVQVTKPVEVGTLPVAL